MRGRVLILLGVLLAAFSAGADTVTVYADDVVTVPERNGVDLLGDTGTWSNEGSATGAPDGQYASVTGPGMISTWARYRIGFSVPDTGFRTGTLNSIQVTVTYRTSESAQFYFVLALESDNGSQPEANLGTLGAYGFGNGATTPLAHKGFPFTASGSSVSMTITPDNINTGDLSSLVGDAAGTNGLMTGSIWAIDFDNQFTTSWNFEIDSIAVTADYTPDGGEGEGEGEGELEIVSATMTPDGLGVGWGDSVTFAITVAGGVEPITYEWFKDSDAIAGATGASYTRNLVTGALAAGSASLGAIDAGATTRWADNISPVDNAGFTNPGNAEGMPDGVFAVATTPAAFGPTAAYYLGFTAQTDLWPGQVQAISAITIRVTYRSNSARPLWAVASFVSTVNGSLPDANIQGLGSSIYNLPLSSFPLLDLSGNIATVDLELPTEDLIIAPNLTPYFSDGTEGMVGEFRGRILITDGASILAPGPAAAFPLEIDSIQMLIDVERLSLELANHPFDYDVVLQSQMLELLALICRAAREEMSCVPLRQYAERARGLLRLEKARQYINANFTRKLMVKEIADQACVSPYHFMRLFKTAFGMTPIQYQGYLRLSEAKKMLVSTDAQVSEIGYRLGYSSPEHFSRQFSASVGVPPSHYTRSLVDRFKEGKASRAGLPGSVGVEGKSDGSHPQ